MNALLIRIEQFADKAKITLIWQRILPLIPFLIALFGVKVLTFIYLPIITSNLPVSEYGKLEVFVSLIECAGLIAGLSIADCIYKNSQNKQRISELIGSVWLIALIFQVIIHVTLQFFTFSFPVLWLHVSLFAAGLTGMIELPLSLLLVQQRPWLYAILLISRATAQLILQYIFLKLNFGVAGVLFANSIIEVIFCLILSILTFKKYKMSISKAALKEMVIFTFPLTLAGLAMYAVGSLDRLFLINYLPYETIAHYAIAAKLSLLLAIFAHAFHLWWKPIRFQVYDGKNGPMNALKLSLFGIFFIAVGAVFVYFIAPFFIHLLLPPSYWGAVQYLPLLILASFMNELATILGLGAYKANTGNYVLIANCCGAIIAILGYVVLIPLQGIWGALYATLLAHCVRCSVYFYVNQRISPFPMRQLWR